MVELDKSRSFKYNLEAGADRSALMRFFCISSEEHWNRIMRDLKEIEAKAMRKKLIMGKLEGPEAK